MSMADGLFEVRYEDDIQKIPVEKVSSILLHKSTLITTDAIIAAIENEIDIVFMLRKGSPAGRIWSHKYGSISTIRKNQVNFSRSTGGAEWVISNILNKLQNQTALLFTLSLPCGSTDRTINLAIDKLNQFSEKIRKIEYNTIDDIAGKLRGIEGNASRIYFSTISSHLPPQYQFTSRSQHPAFDMFNSLLNYAYGMLYGKVEGALVRAGIDPYLGIMHRDEYNRPVLVYDAIENFRVWADYVVINLCMQQVIFPDFFEIENGVFYLNEHGKRILIQSMNDYLEDIVKVKGIDRSREQHILLYCQNLATQLKSSKYEK